MSNSLATDGADWENFSHAINIDKPIERINRRVSHGTIIPFYDIFDIYDIADLCIYDIYDAFSTPHTTNAACNQHEVPQRKLLKRQRDFR